MQAEPLSQCLQRHGLLDPALQQLVTHALAHVAAIPAASSDDMPATEGMAAIARYMASIGVYGPASSPFLAAMYGTGEYAQAFSRLAAVKGATFVLRRGVAQDLPSNAPEDGMLTVRVDGQRLRCRRLLGAAAQVQAWAPGCVVSGQSPSSATLGATFRAVLLVHGPLPSLGLVEVGCTLVMPPGAANFDSPMAWGIVHGHGLGACPRCW